MEKREDFIKLYETAVGFSAHVYGKTPERVRFCVNNASEIHKENFATSEECQECIPKQCKKLQSLQIFYLWKMYIDEILSGDIPEETLIRFSLEYEIANDLPMGMALKCFYDVMSIVNAEISSFNCLIERDQAFVSGLRLAITEKCSEMEKV